jgi:metal-responsive CopG/Arc/MetJ family transcriptional regulator
MALQVNVRLNQALLKEIDALTRVLHISRSEWLRNKIAYAVKEETLHLQEAIAKGNITEQELHELLGVRADEINFIVDHLKKGKNTIDKKLKKNLL